MPSVPARIKSERSRYPRADSGTSSAHLSTRSAWRRRNSSSASRICVSASIDSPISDLRRSPVSSRSSSAFFMSAGTPSRALQDTPAGSSWKWALAYPLTVRSRPDTSSETATAFTSAVAVRHLGLVGARQARRGVGLSDIGFLGDVHSRSSCWSRRRGAGACLTRGTERAAGRGGHAGRGSPAGAWRPVYDTVGMGEGSRSPRRSENSFDGLAAALSRMYT